MTDVPATALVPATKSGHLAHRIAVSALARDRGVIDLASVRRWLDAFAEQSFTEVYQVALEDLAGWSTDQTTGNISHDSGRFFVVEGIDVGIAGGPVPHWSQPMLNQPETGILGLLLKEIDGVLHCLVQAKVEPGNINGLQLSPTVQATRSNFTGVHRGRPVPYLSYFLDTAGHSVITDVRQSEQGAWFHRKRNRNMVVEVEDEVVLLDGFQWMTIGQLHELLLVDDLVSMDMRTVLSCLPFTGATPHSLPSGRRDSFRDALLRSCTGEEGSLHALEEVLSWITEKRSSTEVEVQRIPLNELRSWRRVDGRICHESGLFFNVMGVCVRARGREVNEWMQPMIEAPGTGVVAFLVRRIEGVLHVLVNARIEPGFVDVVELAPTVQCMPGNYRLLPPAAQPPFLAEVLGCEPDQVRFATTLSEEGGRFYHTRNRYLVIECGGEVSRDHPNFRWLTVHQLGALLRHSHYLNVQARTLVACLHSLMTEPA